MSNQLPSFLLILLLPWSIKAQEITMENTLTYINNRLAPCCTVNVHRGELIALYHERGQLVREDNVKLADLDIQSIRYDAIHRMLFIDCKGAPGRKCVNRDLPAYGTQGVYRSYARISWPVELSPDRSEGLIKAFRHMIRLVTERGYQNAEPFE
jgi:hypothetical protein